MGGGVGGCVCSVEREVYGAEDVGFLHGYMMKASCAAFFYSTFSELSLEVVSQQNVCNLGVHIHLHACTMYECSN